MCVNSSETAEKKTKQCRQNKTRYKTDVLLDVVLVLLERDGGLEADPRLKFSVTSVGVILNQWGLNPFSPWLIEY